MNPHKKTPLENTRKRLSSYEFFIGNVLNDDTYLEKIKDQSPKYLEEKLDVILQEVKKKPENIFQVLWKLDKNLFSYAVELSDYVAQHYIKMKERNGV